MTDHTITIEEARRFIQYYTDWTPCDDEETAAKGLVDAGITTDDLRRMNLPSCPSSISNKIEAIVYGSAQ